MLVRVEHSKSRVYLECCEQPHELRWNPSCPCPHPHGALLVAIQETFGAPTAHRDTRVPPVYNIVCLALVVLRQIFQLGHNERHVDTISSRKSRRNYQSVTKHFNSNHRNVCSMTRYNIAIVPSLAAHETPHSRSPLEHDVVQTPQASHESSSESRPWKSFRTDW